MNYHYRERVGGAEVQAWLLAKELARQGHDVSYIAESLTGKSNSTESIDNVKVYWIPQRRHFDVLNTLIYYSLLKKIKPDIVVQRYASLYGGIIGYYTHRNSNLYVWISSGDQIPQRNFFIKGEKESFKIKHKPLYKMIVLMANAWLKNLFRNYGMKYVTHPCVQNSVQYDILRNNFNMKGYYFPSGHEIPKGTATKARPPVVLWVGNMGRNKRPELFVELARVCEDIDAQFIMVGNHPDKKYVHSLLSSDKQNDNFEWRGTLSFEKTLSLFDLATIFVNTSQKEGYPNTFIQSWLRGIPVISFGVDPDGVISREGIGKIVCSINEARAAIVEYLNGTNIDTISSRIRCYAMKNFSISLVEKCFWGIVNCEPTSAS